MKGDPKCEKCQGTGQYWLESKHSITKETIGGTVTCSWSQHVPKRKPPVERQPRLTITVRDNSQIWKSESVAQVYLDNRRLPDHFFGATDEEARAAAQSYVDELLAHFREGGT